MIALAVGTGAFLLEVDQVPLGEVADAHGLEPVGLLHLQQGLVGFLVSVRERSDDGATKDLLLRRWHQEISKNAVEREKKEGKMEKGGKKGSLE